MDKRCEPPDTAESGGLDFLSGGGEMGARMRALDWRTTPLGAPDGWPLSLRTAVSVLINSRYPMFLAWGPELAFLYNDGYRPIFGGKHPAALGRPFEQIWAEIWSDLVPLVERALGGEATWSENLQLFMERRGFLEETYFTFSYSPVRGDTGAIDGMFCACMETTVEVLGERRLRSLRDLAAVASETRSVRDACRMTAGVIASNPMDFAFGLLYLASDTGDEAELIAAAGCEPGEVFSPERVALTGDGSEQWPTAPALSSIRKVLHGLDGLPGGAWPECATTAVVLPLARTGHEQVRGYLVTGASPRLPFDQGYEEFFDVVAGSVSNALANAEAYESEARRAEALAELDRAKTRFFSNVSHEFRTPLTLMLGPLDDALGRKDELPQAMWEQLQVAHRNAQRLQRLVNTILDFSRIEAGRARANYLPTDLSRLTQELASNFRSACEKASLDLIVDCPACPEPVYVDREMWEKIVLNLLSNAIKFTLEGQIEVRLRYPEDKVTLTVRDTGVGIAAKDLPRLFERFYRVDEVEGRTYEGTGIGLSLVNELVKLHGGTIAADSRQGKGSSFVVTIPRGDEQRGQGARAANPQEVDKRRVAAYVDEALQWIDDDTPGPPAATRAAEGDSHARPRLLVVDDNADMRRYLRRLLATRYRVDTAEDGNAALSTALADPPDLVLSDIMMPKLDGFGLLEALRADRRTATVPVILLSARAGEEEQVGGLAAGADDYLTKPFSARELLARVEAHLVVNQARRESEQRFRQFADTAPAILWITDHNHEATFLSRGWYEYTGQPEEQGLGHGWADAVHPEDRDCSLERFQQAAENREPFAFDYRLRRGDGTYRWAIASGKPRFGSDGAFLGYTGSVIDVHDRKEAEQELQRTAEQFREVFETIGVSVWIEDFTAVKQALDELLSGDIGDLGLWLAGHPEFVRECIEKVRIVDVNDESISLFGARDKQELLDSLSNVFVDETVPLFADELVAIAEQRDLMRAETRVKTLDGKPLTVLFTIHFDPAANDYSRVVVTLVDITLRKQAETALREADRRKDDFLATLGHELRNPLAPLQSAIETLQLAGQDSATIAEMLDIMDRQVSQLSRLVDDLLDVSRITLGKLELKKEWVSLSDIVESAVADNRAALERGRLHLSVSLPEEAPRLYADPLRLHQVLSNLLSNAAKYTPENGRVWLVVEEASGGVRISVRDTGIGLPPDKHSTIFEMFGQLDRSLERGYKGLGIGLNLVRSIVEMHDGNIAVYSEGEGRGSEFVVWLPGAVPGHSTPPKPQPPADLNAAAVQRRVLVVDDNSDAANALAKLLEMLDQQAEVAGDGLEALARCEEFAPDLVLLDIGLPKLNGYEVARRMRDLPGGEAIEIVAVTGWGQERDIRRAGEAGFDLHLTKPVSLAELRRVLAGAGRGDCG